MAKNFAKSAGEIRPLAPGRGACIASDRITVDAAPVGYMYRMTRGEPGDSGWCFFAGDEDEAYLADAARFEVYDVNTIVNDDPAVLVHLGAAAGCAFFRQGEGFVADPEGAPEET